LSSCFDASLRGYGELNQLIHRQFAPTPVAPVGEHFALIWGSIEGEAGEYTPLTEINRLKYNVKRCSNLI
jgi:hypothetical protein